MIPRAIIFLALFISLFVAVGCSGGSGVPVIPPVSGDGVDLTGTRAAGGEPGGHVLWGFWRGVVDLESGQFEMVPLRGAAFHVNIAGLLEDAPGGLSVHVNSLDVPQRLLDFDLTISHPAPNSDLRGFDVRGILMGPGDTIVAESDPTLVFNAPSGTMLLNADGYTRWWNAVEFTKAGFLGYDDDHVIPGYLIPQTTLNPYKYFSDALAPGDPVVPGVNQSNRGTFSTNLTPPSLTRNYRVRFPVIGGKPKLGFHYAIDASYAPPTGGSPTPKPIGDFPPQANCPEAFHVEVGTEGSSVYYESDLNRGGDLVLRIEVFDWGASSNPEGILGEISGITVESPTLCEPYSAWPIVPIPGSQPNSGVFAISIPNVQPTGCENQNVLVTVKSKNPWSYAPPNEGPDYPEYADLAGYALVEVPVSTLKPSYLSIDVESPNGGEVWPISSQQMIKWAWTDEIPTVDIYLSLDGGASYDVPVALGIANTGQYKIESVANTPTDHGRIRVSSSAEPEIFGESDSDFVIESVITVNMPNGGDFLLAGTSTVIKWTASETVQNVGILLSTDSGGSFLESLSLATPNSGEFVWEYICEEYVSNKCRIEVFDIDQPQVLDASDSDFTILPVPDALITVLSPNGGEKYEAGKPAEITWGASGAISNVAIRLSIDSGLNYDIELTPSTPNDGNFTVGAIPDGAVGNACRIRISDADDPAVNDASDMDFAIIPSITVLSPNGSELWIEGNVREIAWDASSVIDKVIILKSSDSGEQYLTPITLSTDNDGSYMWYIEPSGDTGTHHRIRILDANNTSILDETDADFTIFPEQEAPINVICPNGGETWIAGTSREITWTALPSIPNVKVELSVDGGSTWPYVVVDSTPNDSSFIWDSVPSSAVGDFNRIRISDVLNPSVNDVSNASFTVEEMGEPFLDIESPVNGETWQIGCTQLVQWQWGGLIPNVDISFKLDNLGTYSGLSDDLINNGSCQIPSFEPDYINDLSLWDSPLLTGVVRIESSDDPAIFDEVNIGIPINLGILYDMVQAADPADSDGDNLPDEVELFLGTDPNDRDSDLAGPDAFFDSFEIFGNGYFDYYDLIPDADHDGLIAALDADDNGDGINDGQTTDSDNDGIANYLEYYGYTYNWMSGTYHPWDGHSINKPYFKTDPLQPSSDQDPYSDSMEVSGAFMDVSVESPGDYPMVPAYPDIIVRLEGYDVTVNEEITLEEGKSLEKGTEWSTQTSWGSSYSFQHGWEVSAGVEAGYDDGFVGKVSVSGKYGQTYNTTTTNGVTVSLGGSAASSQEWSKATCTNPTDAAHMKIYLKVYNQGTSCASNIVPTITLKIGNRNVATFDTGTQINLLEPGGVYPAQPSTYWVLDSASSGPIILTLDELRALECGAPVSVVITQMKADVMLMNESGQWESAGDWGEYMARCEAVCSNMYLEIGGGNFLHYLVYSGNEPSAPEVTFGDALAWAAGAGTTPTELWITYTDDSGQQKTASLEDWQFAFDAQTLMDNGFTGSPLQPPTADFNLNHLVLSPYSEILGTIPREQIPDVEGPQVIYAYFDNLQKKVQALTFDYSGIQGVEFVDKDAVVHEMDEVISGSGLFAVQLDTGYVYSGTEVVRAYSVDDSIPYTEADVEKLVYAEIPEPIAPWISEASIYLANRIFRVQTVDDPDWPTTYVTAQFSCSPETVSLIKGAAYGDYSDRWYGRLPDCVTLYNYNDVVIKAGVTADVYAETHYIYGWQNPRAQSSDEYYVTQTSLGTNPNPDEWNIDYFDLDGYGNEEGSLDIVTNEWTNSHTVEMWETDTDMNGDVFLRPRNNDTFTLHWIGYEWPIPVEIAAYDGGKEYRLITEDDCKGTELFGTMYLDLYSRSSCNPIQTFPLVLIYRTTYGNFGKMRIRNPQCYHNWYGDHFSVDIDWITFGDVTF